MSFVVALALLIGLLVVVPVLAHLLRRGRAKPTLFAPVRWIPATEHVAKRRSRIQDRLLLAVRSSIILAFALLGATPLLRCDRAMFVRQHGASIAAVIVLDDSGSMRSKLPTGSSRFSRAKRAALELVDELHEGDSIGLVLAGKPARMLLLPTTTPALLRQQLETVPESDRPTDLVSAIALAESALDRQPHVDKQVIVLSDLAGKLPKLSPRVAAQQPDLAGPNRDCGVISAVRNHGQVAVEVACSKSHPSIERGLQLVRVTEPNRSAKEKTIPLRPGRETFTLENVVGTDGLFVRLAGGDDNPHDDTAPVIDGGNGPSLATYSDPVAGRGKMGGPPILEQALRALNANLSIRPLPTVPEDARDLAGITLLLLDDPPLLSAESRGTIIAFVENGGTAVAFFGPAANQAQLGSLLFPFVERRATWEDSAPSGLNPSSVSVLGAAASSLADIAPRGRLIFDESHDPRTVVNGRWSDQKPFWIERRLGRGLVVTFGLPTSVERSDLALRTGFVALLEQLLNTSEQLGTARVVTVGRPWRFAARTELRVRGPSGPLSLEATPQPNRSEQVIVPSEAGRYQVTLDGQSEERVAMFPPEEVLEPSSPWPVTATTRPNKAAGRLELSRPLVLALLPLLALELALSSAVLQGFLRDCWQWLRESRLTWRLGRSR